MDCLGHTKFIRKFNTNFPTVQSKRDILFVVEILSRNGKRTPKEERTVDGKIREGASWTRPSFAICTVYGPLVIRSRSMGDACMRACVCAACRRHGFIMPLCDCVIDCMDQALRLQVSLPQSGRLLKGYNTYTISPRLRDRYLRRPYSSRRQVRHAALKLSLPREISDISIKDIATLLSLSLRQLIVSSGRCKEENGTNIEILSL